MNNRFIMLLLLIFTACMGISCHSRSPDGEDRIPPASGLSHDEKMILGEKMYREGLLPSGEPMMAVIHGDIPVEGTMFTCERCHLRSGLGSVEGSVITPPTNGYILYRPLPGGLFISATEKKRIPSALLAVDRRPAYTDESLASALWNGVDPAGRSFNPVMPRYMLDEREMGIIVYYLRNLSSEFPPGVTEKTLRFSTIIAEDVSPGDREAMIAPLEAYIRSRNVRAEYHQSRAKFAFAEEMDRSSRQLVLDLWELSGPPDSWVSQLESFYEKEPVFAILGGIAPGEWTPIHLFCEKKKIPCILPVTDFPVISGSDWYTLYFSKGFHQEGESAARYLRSVAELPEGFPVVQVFRNNREGLTIANAFQETRELLGQAPPDQLMLGDDQVLDGKFWRGLSENYAGAVLLLWLDARDLWAIETLARIPKRPPMIFASGKMLNNRLDVIPDSIRGFTFVTYPRRLPEDQHRSRMAVENWMRANRIPATNREISAQMYFLGWMVTDALMHMQRHFYREYFLDVMDMLQDQTYTVMTYPRVSFGPGQRYASKGCYIVQLAQGSPVRLLRKSNWVVH